MPHHFMRQPGKKHAAAWTLWLTGVSGAGKSTLARRIAEHLDEQGLPYEIVDGDEIRKDLCQDLGFGREHRVENIRRIAYVARLLNRHGVIALVAAISPYREAREQARREATNFLEIHVDCCLNTAIARDVKGLYRRALNGEIPHFTGVSDPYEAPLHPDVHIKTDTQPLEESFSEVVCALEERQWLPRRYSRQMAG
jgi:adenylyl-sulfate kinase